MAKRSNYKAKWLAALSETQRTGSDVARSTEIALESITGTGLSAVREVDALHQTLIEAGNAAISLFELLDETRFVGSTTFKKLEHGIDSHISQMPSKIIARRVRDAIRVAEERIGILSAICEDYGEALSSVHNVVGTASVGNGRLQRTLLESVLFGKGATANDIEDYQENPAAHKRQSEYHCLDDEFSTLTVSRESKETMEYSDSDDDRSDATGDISTAVTLANRNGKILKKRNDSAQLVTM